MKTNSNQDNENPEWLRKQLRELPPVNPSPDFELRLQRRINELHTRRGQRLSERIRDLIRIPTFNVGLVTLIVVGVISLLMLRQSQDTDQVEPVMSEPRTTPDRTVVPSTPEEIESGMKETPRPTPSPSAVKKDERKEIRNRADETTSDRRKMEVQAVRPVEPALKQRVAPAPEARGEVNTTVVAPSVAPVSSQAEETQPAESEQKVLQDESIQSNAPPLQVAPFQKRAAGATSKPGLRNSANPAAIMEFAGRDADSLKRVDSLRLDSVKKAVERSLRTPKKRSRP